MRTAGMFKTKTHLPELTKEVERGEEFYIMNRVSEVAFIIPVNKYRNRITQESFEDYTNLLRLTPITVDRFSSAREAIYFTGKLASKYNLSSYGASYLDLAVRLEASISPFDKKLGTAGVQADINSIV